MSQVEVKHDWEAKVWDWPLQHNDGIVKLINTNAKFEVGLTVPYFTPKEIEIKVIGDELVIHCHHDERADAHGTITREIHRCYKLPHDVNPASIKSHLGQNGVLMISADKKK